MTTDRTLAVASPAFTLSLLCFCVCYEEQTVLLIFFLFFEGNWGPIINIYKTKSTGNS